MKDAKMAANSAVLPSSCLEMQLIVIKMMLQN
jgi:hypothetical protein